MLYAQAVTVKSVQTMTVVFDTSKRPATTCKKQVATLQSSDASAASSAQEKIDSISSLLTLPYRRKLASAVALVSAFSTTLATMPNDSAAAAGLVSSYGTIVTT